MKEKLHNIYIYIYIYAKKGVWRTNTYSKDFEEGGQYLVSPLTRGVL